MAPGMHRIQWKYSDFETGAWATIRLATRQHKIFFSPFNEGQDIHGILLVIRSIKYQMESESILRSKPTTFTSFHWPCCFHVEMAVHTNFKVDEALMSLLKESINSWDCGDENTEWTNNVLSTQLVMYGDGMISKRNETPVPAHSVSSDELQLCKAVLSELAARCNFEVGVGSEGSTVFGPFYITAQVGTRVPTEMSAEMIRTKF